MRMRKKKNLDERLLKCEKYLVANPSENKGKWKNVFGNDNLTFLEIGCGKGKFSREFSILHPEFNFIAMEKISDVIVMAMENTMEVNNENILYINDDAQNLLKYFEEGELSGIYLNFSDPWKKRDQHHRRLTHKNFLEFYKQILTPEGFIAFKTDNRELFDFSVISFKANNLNISEISYDLHASIYAKENISTEYEINFSNKGFSINYLKAFKKNPKIQETNENIQDIDAKAEKI